MTIPTKLGFCCKFIPENGDAEEARRMNLLGTTMTYLGRVEPKAAFEKLSMVVLGSDLELLDFEVRFVSGRPYRPATRHHFRG